jgi:hypothetical protein
LSPSLGATYSVGAIGRASPYLRTPAPIQNMILYIYIYKPSIAHLRDLSCEVLSEISQTRSQKNAGLLDAMSFKIFSLATYTAIQSVFIFTHQNTVEVIFLNAVQYRLRFPLVSKRRQFSFIFNLGNKAKSQEAKYGE